MAMTDIVLAAKIVAAAAAAVLAGYAIWKIRNRDRQGRLHMLDPFLGVLDRPRVSLTSWRYPAVQGDLDHSAARVDLFPDTLVLRALPTLWLQVRWRRAHSGNIRVTVQPTGTEYFAEADGLHTRFRPPPAWPETTEICGTGSESLQVLHLLRGLDLSAFPSLKQLAVNDREVQVTMCCARGDRTTYRVLRSVKFAADAVSQEIVTETMSLLRTVEERLSGHEPAEA